MTVMAKVEDIVKMIGGCLESPTHVSLEYWKMDQLRDLGRR